MRRICADLAPARLLQTLGVALLLSSLSQLVLLARAFSHDQRFLHLLADGSALGWLWVGLWTLVLAWRQRLDPKGTELLFASQWRYGAVCLALLTVVISPFVNAYFTHLTHPTLALALVWTLWPALRRGHASLLARLATAVATQTPNGTPGKTALAAAPWLAALAATAVIFLQSYRRHLWFGSGGKDLGLFHQTVWLLSRFETPSNTVMGMHAFADHMEFVDLLAAPLQWLWPSAGALLLFQAGLVGLGVLPVFWLGRDRLGSSGAGLALAMVFVCGIDMQNAVMFDWNPTTCGVAVMPWVVWSHDREAVWPFAVAVGIVALAKENLVLYAAGLCLALALDDKRRAFARRAWVAVALLALLFLVEMKVLFPLFRPEGFRHLRLEALGEDPAGILANVLHSPYRALALLFTPGRKIDGLLAPLSTVAFLCLLAPRYVLALLPSVLERFWSSHANRWWGFHYGVGAGVVATLAAIAGLERLQARWPARTQAWRGGAVLLVLTSALLVASLGRFGPGPLWLWRHSYYTTAADRRDAERALAIIPRDASVAAQNHLLPHLSARRAIYEIRRPIATDYVALDFVQSAWPFKRDYPRQLASTLRQQGYGVVACEGNAVVLRHGANDVPCPALGP